MARCALLPGTCTLAALFALCIPAGRVCAQESYPSRPIRIVVPQSPSGQMDVTARLVGHKLTEAFKQTLVIDNRPGAGSVNGTELVSRAAPDGYTLLAAASSFAINPSLYAKLPYDSQRDFAPIVQLSRFPYVLSAHPTLPAQSLQEVIALAKAKPGHLNYASSGPGTGTHLAMELLRQMTGTDIVHIPYKGGGPAAIATMSRQVELLMGTTVVTLNYVRAGKLKAIAITSPQRSPGAPDLPTFAESGVPGYEHETWNGFLAPAKTPRAIIAKFNAETARVLATPEIKKAFAIDGAQTVGEPADVFATLIRSETAKWAKVIKIAGIKPL